MLTATTATAFVHHASSSFHVKNNHYTKSSGAADTSAFRFSSLKNANDKDDSSSGVSIITADEESSLSSSSSSTDDQPQQKYNDLLAWIASQQGSNIDDNGEDGSGSIVHPSIVIQPSTLGGGYGLFCVEAVKEGTVLLQIPQSATVTLENALASMTASNDRNKEAFEALMQKAGPGSTTVVLAGFLALERLKSLEYKKNKGIVKEDSAFGPYLDTLPWERGINNQEHILFWSDGLVETLLPGTMCYEEVLDLRGEVDVAISVLNQILGDTVRTWRGEYVPPSGFQWPWETVQVPASYDPSRPVKGLPEAVKGAFVSLLTRSFEDNIDDDDGGENDGEDEDDTERLVPLMDLMQHSEEPNIRHSKCPETGAIRVTARTDMPANTELLNQYRSELEESMPYHRFFSRFGFVPGIMDEDDNDEFTMETLLREKSSIFFAQKAEV